jgi:hypothetical protein
MQNQIYIYLKNKIKYILKGWERSDTIALFALLFSVITWIKTYNDDLVKINIDLEQSSNKFHCNGIIPDSTESQSGNLFYISYHKLFIKNVGKNPTSFIGFKYSDINDKSFQLKLLNGSSDVSNIRFLKHKLFLTQVSADSLDKYIASLEIQKKRVRLKDLYTLRSLESNKLDTINQRIEPGGVLIYNLIIVHQMVDNLGNFQLDLNFIFSNNDIVNASQVFIESCGFTMDYGDSNIEYLE